VRAAVPLFAFETRLVAWTSSTTKRWIGYLGALASLKKPRASGTRVLLAETLLVLLRRFWQSFEPIYKWVLSPAMWWKPFIIGSKIAKNFANNSIYENYGKI